ncbi:MAG: adenine phosphoribosyltransferase [Acidobacteriota bacterium]
MDELKKIIREVPDYPKPGILFYDITTLLKNPDAFKRVIDILTERYRNKGINKVLGIDSRGFIFAPCVAYNLGVGFVPVRKKGKLPAETLSVDYDLEYGSNTIEIHKDSLEPGDRVVIIDDLIATGGTATATAKLVEALGAELVEMAFMIELTFLNGRDILPENTEVFSVLKYDL